MIATGGTCTLVWPSGSLLTWSDIAISFSFLALARWTDHKETSFLRVILFKVVIKLVYLFFPAAAAAQCVNRRTFSSEFFYCFSFRNVEILIKTITGTNRSVFMLQDHFGYNSVQFGITWYNSIQFSTTLFNSLLKPNNTELYRVITWYNSVRFSLF